MPSTLTAVTFWANGGWEDGDLEEADFLNLPGSFAN